MICACKSHKTISRKVNLHLSHRFWSCVVSSCGDVPSVIEITFDMPVTSKEHFFALIGNARLMYADDSTKKYSIPLTFVCKLSKVFKCTNNVVAFMLPFISILEHAVTSIEVADVLENDATIIKSMHISTISNIFKHHKPRRILSSGSHHITISAGHRRFIGAFIEHNTKYVISQIISNGVNVTFYSFNVCDGVDFINFCENANFDFTLCEGIKMINSNIIVKKSDINADVILHFLAFD